MLISIISGSIFDNLELTLLFQNILIKSSLMCVCVCSIFPYDFSISCFLKDAI